MQHALLLLLLLIYIKLLKSHNYPLLPFLLLLFPLLSCSSLFLVCLSSGTTWSLLLPCFSFLGYIPSLRFWFLSLLVGKVSWMPSCLKYKVNNYVSKWYRTYFLNNTSLKFSDWKTFDIKHLVHTTCSLDINYIVCFWSQQWMSTTAYSVHQSVQVKNEYMSYYKNYVLYTVKTYFCVIRETQQGKFVTWSTSICTLLLLQYMWKKCDHIYCTHE